MLIVLIINFALFGASQSTGNGSIYLKLRNSILANYDPNIKPLKDFDKPIDVSMLITFERLMAVDTKSSSITFESYMVLKWTDEFLKWNPQDYQGIDHLDLPPKLVWRPDVIASTYQTNFFEDDSLNLAIKSNGEILWIRILIISFKCRMDLTDFPFDKQQCRFPIFVRYYSTGSVNLIPYGGISEPALNFAHSNNPEWAVVLDPVRNISKRNDSNPIIFLKMNLTRRSSAYHYVMVLPYIASNLLIFYAFFLPQSSRCRILIGTFALFVDISLIMLIGYMLGFDSSHNVPYAVKCLSINILMVGVFIVISVFGSRYIAKSTSQSPIWIHGLVTNEILEKILVLKLSAKELDDIDSEMVKINSLFIQSSTNDMNHQSVNDWILLTAILDRFYLIVYVVFFVFYHS